MIPLWTNNVCQKYSTPFFRIKKVGHIVSTITLKLKKELFAYDHSAAVFYSTEKHIKKVGTVKDHDRDEHVPAELPSTAVSYYVSDQLSKHSKDDEKKVATMDVLTRAISGVKLHEFSDEFVFGCEGKTADYRPC